MSHVCGIFCIGNNQQKNICLGKNLEKPREQTGLGTGNDFFLVLVGSLSKGGIFKGTTFCAMKLKRPV